MFFFFFQAEDGIRDAQESRGLGDVYKRQPQGRLLCHGLALRTTAGFLLDCHADIAPKLLAHLTRYRLRAKVEMAAQPSLGVWSILGGGGDRDADWCFQDPRLEELGQRAIVKTRDTDTPAVPEAVWDVARLGMGLADRVEDTPPGGSFPLESNLELLHGISWQKGCYLGQELTARTFHTGKTRKRLVTVVCEGGPVLGEEECSVCLLYTSDAADEEDSVDLGGRRVI
eukprot:TRINITY_DN9435_c0_g1_i1.p1 TRINITY_DN9435_c0_g1~~TRINITY_DN9435_c0_g1_i1.p1  ORF type:complete len:228 (+),score=58.97 TRINITY_DN9435_c0_g1_i1:83-766(+)